MKKRVEKLVDKLDECGVALLDGLEDHRPWALAVALLPPIWLVGVGGVIFTATGDIFWRADSTYRRNRPSVGVARRCLHWAVVVVWSLFWPFIAWAR